jgi:predicted aldo/keto reductase-like oxidoreductase
VLHYVIDHGVNCLDTAYPNHRENSARVVGKALQGGYRERVNLVTKLPAWAMQSRSGIETYLNEQLETLQTEQIDV